MGQFRIQACLLILWFADGSAQSSVELSKPSIDFGIARTKRAVTDTVGVTNTGVVDMFVERMDMRTTTFDLPPEGVTSGFTLRPEETHPVAVRFNPPSTGTFADTLSIRSIGSSILVPLSGIGVRSTVVINEILADPPGGPNGDANGDGVRSSYADEFVEILNIGTRIEKIAGWRLSDDDTAGEKQFVFPDESVLGPGERAVLFGGGIAPAGLSFLDDGRIGNGLTNSGDVVLLIDPYGPDTLDIVGYGSEGGKDQSIVRYPEGTGGFVLHRSQPGDDSHFSPGTPRNVLSSIGLTPKDTAVAVGDSVVWKATGMFSNGTSRDLTDDIVWTTQDSDVVRVGGGIGIAIGFGTVEIRGSVSDLLSIPAVVTVYAPELSRLSIAPADTVVVVGSTVPYRAEGTGPGGTKSGLISGLSWTVEDSGLANLAGEGVVLPLKAGETKIRAAAGEVVSPDAVLRIVARGDLNGIADVEVSDVLRMIDIILEVSPEPTPLELSAGDMNGDGGIDVLDLTWIIDMILGKSGPPSTKFAGVTGCRYEVNVGEEDGMAELVLDCPEAVRVVQIDLVGIEKGIASVGVADGMTLAYHQISEAKTRVLLFSLEGKVIPPGKGPILEFRKDGWIEELVVAGRNFKETVVQNGLREEEAGADFGFRLRQSYPNPANGTVAIGYDVPEALEVSLEIFDLLGRSVIRLMKGYRSSGRHLATWNGKDGKGRGVGNGVYFIRLKAGAFVDVRKLVWLK